MEPMISLIKNAPEGANYHSDVTHAYYFKGQASGLWYIHANGYWQPSAHGKATPRRLIPLNIVWDNPCDEVTGPEAVISPFGEDDEVNQPSHYKRKSSNVLRAVRSALLEGSDIVDLECIEAMLSHLSTVDQIRGYLRGSSFKYRWRYEDKDRIKSLKKAGWYEDKLVELEEIVEEHNAA